MKRTLLLLSVLCLMTGFSVFANGQQDKAAIDEPVTLKIYAQYSSDNEKLPFDYAEAAMKEAMPNVVLDLDVRGQDDDVRLRTYAAAGNLPDIFQTTGNVVAQFMESGFLAQLDDAIKKSGIDKLTLPFAKPALYAKDGHAYAALCAAPYSSAMYYNESVFKENGMTPPTNIDELVEVVSYFSSKDIIPLAIFAKENWPGVQLYDMIVSREEPVGILGIDNGTHKITEEAYVKAAEKLQRLVEAGLITRGAFNTSSDEASMLFMEDKAAMFINGLWAAKSFGEEMGENVKIMPYYYPLADAGKEKDSEWQMSGGTMDHSGFSVSASSSNLELASEYVVAFSHKFAEGRTVKRGAPKLYSDTPAPEIKMSTVYKKAVVQDPINYKTTSGFTWSLKTAETRTALEDAVARMLAGGYTAEEFIADLDKNLK